MKDIAPIDLHARVEQSFRRGLDTYHANATCQAAIAQRLADLLADHAPKHLGHVLEFGAGTGHFTGPLQKQFTIDRLTLNDLVADAQSFLPKGTDFQAGPIETITLPTKLDLIASTSTVQWVEDIPSLMDRFDHHLKPGGLIALTGFGSAHFHELIALGSNSAAPSYVDAQGWKSLLPPSLKIRHLSHGRRVSWFKDTRALLRHLRNTGVNASAGDHWTASKLKEFERDYRTRFGTPRGLPLTYDPVWMIAQKDG